jgi:hypothetical protein
MVGGTAARGDAEKDFVLAGKANELVVGVSYQCLDV